MQSYDNVNFKNCYSIKIKRANDRLSVYIYI